MVEGKEEEAWVRAWIDDKRLKDKGLCLPPGEPAWSSTALTVIMIKASDKQFLSTIYHHIEVHLFFKMKIHTFRTQR